MYNIHCILYINLKQRIIMNRVDLNWILQFRVDGSVKPSRLKEILALCIMYMYFYFIVCMTIVTRALYWF